MSTAVLVALISMKEILPFLPGKVARADLAKEMKIQATAAAMARERMVLLLCDLMLAPPVRGGRVPAGSCAAHSEISYLKKAMADRGLGRETTETFGNRPRISVVATLISTVKAT